MQGRLCTLDFSSDSCKIEKRADIQKIGKFFLCMSTPLNIYVESYNTYDLFNYRKLFRIQFWIKFPISFLFVSTFFWTYVAKTTKWSQLRTLQRYETCQSSIAYHLVKVNLFTNSLRYTKVIAILILLLLVKKTSVTSLTIFNKNFQVISGWFK